MSSVVVGLVMLAGAAIGAREAAFAKAARGLTGEGGSPVVTMTASGAEARLSGAALDGDVAVNVEGVGEAGGDDSDAPSQALGADGAAAGAWEVACELKSGHELVFDRRSVREFGAVTLFRWAAPADETPEPDDRVYTAVANCRQKTIEAAWPGKRTDTRAGTCGRRLVEAVCAATAAGAPSGRGRRPGPAAGRTGEDDVTTPRR